jgi:hypothetical protein
MNAVRGLAILVIIIAIVGIALGGVFVWQGISKNAELTTAMEVEQVRLPLHPEEGETSEPSLIDTAAEAQAAGDIIRGHRRAIAPTYQDLLGEGRFDPTNPEHLDYAQALNMENYLYLAVVGFGLTQVVLASGVFMIITGLALGGTGVALIHLNR